MKILDKIAQNWWRGNLKRRHQVAERLICFITIEVNHPEESSVVAFDVNSVQLERSEKVH